MNFPLDLFATSISTDINYSRLFLGVFLSVNDENVSVNDLSIISNVFKLFIDTRFEQGTLNIDY
jgi:hypothetical protein